MKRLILWLALLLPLFAKSQVNGTLQKTAATSIVRGAFGSIGVDTLAAVRLTGIIAGQSLIYNSTTKKFHATSLGISNITSLQDSLTIKANKSFNNVTGINLTSGIASDSLVVVRNGKLYSIAGADISSIGFMSYIFSRDVSDIAGYEQMPALTSYTTGTIDTANATVSIAETLLQEFATNSGFPNTTIIPAGIFNVHYDTQKGAGSINYYTYAKIYKRSSAGVETLLATTDNSTQTAVNTVVSSSISSLINTQISLLTTDRIVVKVYAKTLSSTASINLYYDNATNARLEFPSALVNATNFVPYVGATKDLVSAFSIQGAQLKLDSNALSSTANHLYQTISNDYFKQYAYGTITDRGEWIFEAGDNGVPWASGGERWRYSYTSGSSGAAKDVFLIDYDAISTPNALTALSFSGSGTGLTGTASSLNIGGNAATATLAANSTLWGGATYGGPYLPLAGGTLTGALTGTSATFSGNLSWGTGSFSQGTLYNNATSGAILVGKAGSSTDFALLSSAGTFIFSVPTGTSTLALAGALTGTSGTFSGNISAANLTSGTYTPTITNMVNMSTVNASPGFYIRIGDRVSFSFYFLIPTVIATATNSSFQFSLPISSNFTGTLDMIGTITHSDSSPHLYGKLASEATNNTGIITFTTGDTGGIGYYITGHYTIL